MILLMQGLLLTAMLPAAAQGEDCEAVAAPGAPSLMQAGRALQVSSARSHARVTSAIMFWENPEQSVNIFFLVMLSMLVLTILVLGCCAEDSRSIKQGRGSLLEPVQFTPTIPAQKPISFPAGNSSEAIGGSPSSRSAMGRGPSSRSAMGGSPSPQSAMGGSPSPRSAVASTYQVPALPPKAPSGVAATGLAATANPQALTGRLEQARSTLEAPDTVLSARGRLAGARSQHLCPGLVVPRGSECVLAVGLASPSAASTEVAISDLSGSPVLKAELCRSDTSRPRVVLKPTALGGADEAPLASCHLTKAADGNVGMEICRADGSIFGQLARDPSRPRYVMKPDFGNQTLLFDGIFEDHAVLIMDEVQEALADAEPCSMPSDPAGKYFRLRVSSDVDVGLVLACLLSIEELQTAA